ncbi:MAG: hypothetical protein R6W90_17475 [Ignavibacteriaceae bacterium]
MSLIRFIFFIVAFYFVFKVIKYLIRYLVSTGNSRKGNPDMQNQNSRNSSKYGDIEEAKYIEIDSEPRRDNSKIEK